MNKHERLGRNVVTMFDTTAKGWGIELEVRGDPTQETLHQAFDRLVQNLHAEQQISILSEKLT